MLNAVHVQHAKHTNLIELNGFGAVQSSTSHGTHIKLEETDDEAECHHIVVARAKGIEHKTFLMI